MQLTIIYKIKGFDNYVIENKQLYRLKYVTKSKSCKFQYRSKRAIKIVEKDNKKGYFLVRNNERRFYSLESLHHRLKLIK